MSDNSSTHRIRTPEDCTCQGGPGRCPTCNWGLAVCMDCGAAEADLDERPCPGHRPTGHPADHVEMDQIPFRAPLVHATWSIRDDFAVAAMRGILSNSYIMEYIGRNTAKHVEHVAMLAYKQADAMMAERGKQQ